MPLRRCLGHDDQDCTRLVQDRNRCPEHERQHEAHRHRHRPSARERGYDAEYERNRDTLRRTAPPICHRCRRPIDLTLPASDPMSWTADHVIPLSRGGTNHLSNLAPAHAVCNNSKNNASNE